MKKIITNNSRKGNPIYWGLKMCLSIILLVLTFSNSYSSILSNSTGLNSENLAPEQQTSVQGNVKDANGVPLPGVNIIIVGTSKGTQSDFDGNYSLEGVPANAVLSFSFVGFSTKQVTVGGQTRINVVLLEDANKLDEVVVVGYGTTTKKDATGAVNAISAKDLTAVSSINPGSALRGKVAGVQVSQTNGEPGGGLNIRIRGNSSIRGGNEPLIVVDGIPLAGGGVSAGGADIGGVGSSSAKSALNFINQDDIESITILKDASSTAIYGSRGANGVVIITTKGGKSGAAQYDFNSNISFASLRGDIDMMTGDQYASKVSELGLSQDFGGRSYDWKETLLQTGISTNYSLGATFGNGGNQNRLSLGVQDVEGIVKNTGLQRYSLNFDNKTTAFDELITLNTKVSVSQIEDQAENTTDNAGFIGNIVGVGLYWNPTRELRNSNGTINVVSDTYLNPEDYLNSYTDKTSTTRVLASVAPTVKLSDNLSFNMIIGVDYSTSERASALLPTFQLQGYYNRNNPNGDDNLGGFAAMNAMTRFNKTFENYFTYNKTVSDNFSYKALLGYSYYDYNVEGFYVSARDFNPAQTNLIDNIEGGLATETRTSSFRSRNELQSFFGRFESVINDKLLVTASLRIDGSTRPGADEKYGTFPAIGAAYKFIENGDGNLNNLKLRVNYGITGNQEFDNNSALFVGQYNNGGFSPTTNVNNKLKWETTTSYGAGIDYSVLDNKVTGSLDFFLKDTKDLIFPTDPAGGVPGASIRRFINLDGSLENLGFEFSVNYDVIDSEDLDFSVGTNMSFLKNEMKNFKRIEFTGNLHGQGLSNAQSQIIKEGEPLFTYYLKEWAGFDSNGLSQYIRNDGSITDLSDAPEKVLSGKSGLPDFNIGFNTSLRYKKLDFTTSWYGQYGHYIYNNTANAYFYMSAFNGGRNMPISYVNSGQSASDVATPSSLYLEKGDFLRLGELGIGYTFDTANYKYINSLRVFFNGSNLLTFTDYSGFDPEVSVAKYNSNGVPSAGIDYLGYPNSKSFTFGLNVKF
ncbi:SusC/RagA family TonB-linked outer membrane protein [Lutibacter sp.]|uniref:SusC/RagA family TonB-linked outer membrane protein n=1 Tax=Lutibacter sp. TaxID=1925666 RepID=UPI0027356840|nr:SusC/RagA family TonB-linked outer membrane protein [Lutibacter sp.]MDP3314024.1 SusC/RagA family TonB-linked outer membrane protein [Lutibacter sp.]